MGRKVRAGSIPARATKQFKSVQKKVSTFFCGPIINNTSSNLASVYIEAQSINVDGLVLNGTINFRVITLYITSYIFYNNK